MSSCHRPRVRDPHDRCSQLCERGRHRRGGRGHSLASSPLRRSRRPLRHHDGRSRARRLARWLGPRRGDRSAGTHRYRAHDRPPHGHLAAGQHPHRRGTGPVQLDLRLDHRAWRGYAPDARRLSPLAGAILSLAGSGDAGVCLAGAAARAQWGDFGFPHRVHQPAGRRALQIHAAAGHAPARHGRHARRLHSRTPRVPPGCRAHR